ncbi:glycerophosphodiester phosphodiesterase family protein [Hymenobacter humi]|uniref:Glycerophosphodiester phosphodiesterase family protein n=1 Tax=Hymenobacter humi TaxID=1411620 RepID=A0ABW2U1F0_9BACT
MAKLHLDRSFNPHPEVHGHRGCRGLRPENTLPAFLYALELGVDVIELDVVISADKQVVVSHEPWLNPSICLDSNGQFIPPSQARQLNLYPALRRNPAVRLRPTAASQLSRTTFSACLQAFADGGNCSPGGGHQALGRSPVGYSIEVKSSPDGDLIFHPGPEEFLALVLAEVDAAQIRSRTTLLCFDPRILRLAHHNQPNLATCLLLEADQPWHSSIEQARLSAHHFRAGL